MKMKLGLKLFIFAVMIGAACCTLFAQEDKGEKWSMKISVSMMGFSMPAQTSEVCLPANQSPDEAMMQQQNIGGDCQISNLQRSGNKTSADIKCGGKDKMEGRFEIETAADTTRGTMTAKTSDGEMVMKYDMTRLKQECVPQAAPKAKQKR